MKKMVQNFFEIFLIEERELLLKNQFLELKEKSSLTDKTFRNLVEAEETRQLKVSKG